MTLACDGCDKAAPGKAKPPEWYQRTDEDGVTWIACSLECICTVGFLYGAENEPKFTNDMNRFWRQRPE